jgi:uncharacterized protein YyaL (SSP411 family)
MKMIELRKILLVAIAIFASGTLAAQKSKRKTVPQKKKVTTTVGYKKAIATNKILLVDAYTDWCGWCKVMDRETYTDPAVLAILEKDFVCVKFNPEIDKNYVFGDRTMDGRTLLLWLGYGESGGFPTTYFWLNPNKNDSRFNQAGYYPPTEFLKLLDNAKLNRTKI